MKNVKSLKKLPKRTCGKLLIRSEKSQQIGFSSRVTLFDLCKS
jgi:hypothetical protein